MTRDELISGNGELRSAALEELTPHRLGWPGDREYRNYYPGIREESTLPPFDNWRFGPLVGGLSHDSETQGLDSSRSHSKARKTAAVTTSRLTVTPTPHREHVSTPS